MVLKFGGVTLLKGIGFHMDSSHHTFADSTDSTSGWPKPHKDLPSMAQHARFKELVADL